MELLALVTLLILVEYFVFMGLVGYARGLTGVKAPAVSGDPQFERYLRVQQNTVEQLVWFLPSMWLFAHYVHMLTAVGLGVIFFIGRLIYAVTYYKDAEKRSLGFVMGWLASIVALLGALIGVLLKIF